MTKPELDALWLRTLEDAVNLAAHDVKDALNGVSLNLEVVRSRALGPSGDAKASTLGSFAEAASDQLEVLTARLEAVLFLSRPAREPADVAVVLKHVGALIGPALKGEESTFRVDLAAPSCVTGASGQATRLGIVAGGLALLKAAESKGKRGLARCSLDPAPEPVVRFSHESAGACSLSPATISVLAANSIRTETAGADLILRFPKT